MAANDNSAGPFKPDPNANDLPDLVEFLGMIQDQNPEITGNPLWRAFYHDQCEQLAAWSEGE